MVWDESNLVIERVNGATVTEANLLQQAVHGVLSKQSRGHFKKMVEALNVVTRPFEDDSPEER